MKRLFIKGLKIAGGILAAVLLLLFLIPIIFPSQVNEKIKSWTNSSIKGQLDFSKARLSFFNHFPSLTLTIHDVSLLGSKPFASDTLVLAKEIALGINVGKLFLDKEVVIDKIFLSNADIKVLVSENGEPNYNVYESTESESTKTTTDSSGTSLKLKKIQIDNSRLLYHDQSVDFLINARGFNYEGTGDLSEAVFDLKTQAHIDALDLSFDNEVYLKNKAINADLITKINTHSLALIFEKNDLKINKLPITFNGKLNFLKNGYDIDLHLKSTNSKLNDFITAFPPQYLTWQEQTTIKGKTDLDFTMKGNYIASTNEMPNVKLAMQIRDGYISHTAAPLPLENLFINMRIDMPLLNSDSLSVDIDSLNFNVDKSYLRGRIKTLGIDNPYINTDLNTSLDLDNTEKAIGIPGINLKGKLDLSLKANGRYAYTIDTFLTKKKSVLKSIPVYTLNAVLKNGYFKHDSLPLAAEKINFNFRSACKSSDYGDVGFELTDFSTEVLKGFIKGNAKLTSVKEKEIDINLKGDFSLGDFRKIFPIEDIELDGDMHFDIVSNGRLNPETKLFPVTKADVQLKNGVIKTPYYPAPLQDINLNAVVTDQSGTTKGVKIKVAESSLAFEGKKFFIDAELENLDDITYAVNAKGDLDVGKIYQVFAVENVNIDGTISADLNLKGKQSDATAGRLQKLSNKGELQLKNISIISDYYPQAFVIKNGLLKFNQDKIWLQPFQISYDRSVFNVTGYISDIFPYLFKSDGVLKGKFGLQSESIFLDDLMAYSLPQASNLKDSSTMSAGAGTILIPGNLDLQLQFDVKNLHYRDLVLQDVKSDVVMQGGRFAFSNTGFGLIGCSIKMEGAYSSSDPSSASFEYKIDAQDFDVKKAYQQVALFRELAPAAKNAAGLISIDYSLKGNLNENMDPVYPSLEGNGSLYLKDVKLNGMKLFTAVSRKTGKDSINNPRLTKVKINSSISKNVITIERFKFKVFGFRTRIEGQTNFDGKIKFAMRLGLPPFGLIGIPMTVTGTHEDPKIKLGKSDNEPLEETEAGEDL
jgi:AsmA protein